MSGKFFMVSAYTEGQGKVTVVFINVTAVLGVEGLLVSTTHLGKDRFLFL